MAVPVVAAAFALMLLSAGVAVAGPGDNGQPPGRARSGGRPASEAAHDQVRPGDDGGAAEGTGEHGDHHDGRGGQGGQGGQVRPADPAAPGAVELGLRFELGLRLELGLRFRWRHQRVGRRHGDPAIPAPTVSPTPAVVDAVVALPAPVAAPEVAPAVAEPAPVDTPAAVPVAAAVIATAGRVAARGP